MLVAHLPLLTVILAFSAQLLTRLANLLTLVALIPTPLDHLRTLQVQLLTWYPHSLAWHTYSVISTHSHATKGSYRSAHKEEDWAFEQPDFDQIIKESEQANDTEKLFGSWFGDFDQDHIEDEADDEGWTLVSDTDYPDDGIFCFSKYFTSDEVFHSRQ
uniref:Uncharacterized protein n=1 Tax=Ditylenchus dipsaci TaxID=166011 RepID=A0A915E4J8_9BILA